MDLMGLSCRLADAEKWRCMEVWLYMTCWDLRMGEYEGNVVLITSWPSVGNEGMNPQYTNVKVDSLIPY